MLCLNPVVAVKLTKILIILISMKFEWSQNQNVDSPWSSATEIYRVKTTAGLRSRACS